MYLTVSIKVLLLFVGVNSSLHSEGSSDRLVPRADVSFDLESIHRSSHVDLIGDEVKSTSSPRLIQL
jgi:hypothetical protein